MRIAKQRMSTNPFVVTVCTLAMAGALLVGMPSVAAEGADAFQVDFNQAIATWSNDGGLVGAIYIAERVWDGERHVFMSLSLGSGCYWSGNATESSDLSITSHEVSMTADLELECDVGTVPASIAAEWVWSGSPEPTTRVENIEHPDEGEIRSYTTTTRYPEIDSISLSVDGVAYAGTWWGAVLLETTHYRSAPDLPETGNTRWDMVENVEMIVTRTETDQFEFSYRGNDGSDCYFFGVYVSDPQTGPIGGYWFDPRVDRNGLLALLSAGTWVHFQTRECGANGGDYGARGLYAQLIGLEVGESFSVNVPMFKGCEAPEPNGCES